MRARLLVIGLLAAALYCALPFPAIPAPAAEDTAGTAADTVALLQQRISADVAGPREAVEAELKDFPLSSADIARRVKEIETLTASASADMAQWGYTTAERERYLHLLSDVNLAYTAYNTNLQTLETRQNSVVVAVAASKDADLPAPVSSDINAYDALQQSIRKAFQEIQVQVFHLGTILNKVDIVLADVARFKRQSAPSPHRISEGDDGRRPEFQILELESARLKLASAWLQTQESRIRCNESIQKIRQDQRKLERIQANLTFPEVTLNRNIEALQKRIDELKQQLIASKKNFDEASTSLTQARLALAPESADINTLTPASSRYMERMANLNYWEYYTALIQDEIEFLTDAQEIWRSRYRLFNEKATGEEIWRYRDDAQSKITGHQTQLESIRTLQSNFYHRISTTRGLVEEATGRTQQNLTQMLISQQKTITNVLNRYLYLLPNQIQLERTLYEEAGARINALRLAEKVTDFSKKTFLSFWNTELWSGEGYSVSVSQLITALLVFISSFFLSAWGSRWIQRRMIRRFGASVTAANAVQRIVFYVLWFSFVLVALQIVDIPLTAFAFLGGALALAIGFGAQTLFNNLISGFIIMFNRPFQIADIIEVDGISGTVEEIGSRSTRIKTWESLDVILPNRYLLENQVTNWTGSDKKKRGTLKVSVSYGSDSRHVEELLLKVLKDHSKVLKDPAPYVLFKEFDENGLEFELYFWVDLNVSSLPKVASDMRHHILSLFRNEGVEIPYPQRVVHILPDAGTDAPEAPLKTGQEEAVS